MCVISACALNLERNQKKYGRPMRLAIKDIYDRTSLIFMELF